MPTGFYQRFYGSKGRSVGGGSSDRAEVVGARAEVGDLTGALQLEPPGDLLVREPAADQVLQVHHEVDEPDVVADGRLEFGHPDGVGLVGGWADLRVRRRPSDGRVEVTKDRA